MDVLGDAIGSTISTIKPEEATKVKEGVVIQKSLTDGIANIMEAFQTQNKGAKPVNVADVAQGLGDITDGITEAIVLAKPEEAAKVAEAKEITKVVIFGLASFADAMLGNPALAKLLNSNRATPVS